MQKLFQIGKIYVPRHKKGIYNYIFIYDSKPSGGGLASIRYAVLGSDEIKTGFSDPNVWEEVNAKTSTSG